MKVKVCGITNIADALTVEHYGANAVGFIFYKASKRYISPDTACKIIEQISPFTMKVGVFVNEDASAVNKIAGDIKLNAVQIHGDESYEFSNNINYPVIRGFRVKENFDYSELNKLKKASILLDAFSDSEYGGTGKTFNWKLIPAELKSRIILAGGISIDNIEEIITAVNPAAVDVSSSLEKEPGIKDEQKIKQFFKIINSYRS